MEKKKIASGLIALLFTLAMAQFATAEVAGTTALGVSVEEMQTVMNGWSAKKAILGKPVYNDQNQKIGKAEDIIIAPDKSISYIILEVGGFLGMGTHKVALPVDQFSWTQKRLVLPGATKDALKKMPEFKYAR
ncbi:MAG TPA: PRC-barrel domain-containing protein [Dissulfurispiraceae bacterium]